MVSSPLHNSHANTKESPAPTRGQTPIQSTNLSRLLETFGEQPHNLGTLPITRKKSNLASKLDDKVAGLGNDAIPETTTQFDAKAHAPNHNKNDRSLGF